MTAQTTIDALRNDALSLRKAALSLTCTCGRDLMTAERAERVTPGKPGHLRHCHARFREEMLESSRRLAQQSAIETLLMDLTAGGHGITRAQLVTRPLADELREFSPLPDAEREAIIAALPGAIIVHAAPDADVSGEQADALDDGIVIDSDGRFATLTA